MLRLKRRADFLKATRARNSAAAPGLVLQARLWSEAERGELSRAAPGEDILRVGFTASRKVGKAVTRNRAKRRLRALADEVLRAHARPGVDYVVIARAATTERSFEKLRKDMLSALKRVGGLREREPHAAAEGRPTGADAPAAPDRSSREGPDGSG
ncbi:MAG: ribonuclease P protein component [Marivibrio sp.]|uniref:ribonuclease P protein component n=1 Tax=Marivibrio sp. TaxID=2039719 RepID=UPI0032EABF0F